MPYQVNRGMYATAPFFLWQKAPPEPVYRYEVMRDLYLSELEGFNQSFTVRGFLLRGAEKAGSWWQFYVGPLLTIPLLALPWVVRRKNMRLPVAICVVMMVGLALETWAFPHYFSPATGALYILVVQCMRQLRQWRLMNRRLGPALVRAIPALACAMILLRLAAVVMHLPIEPPWPRGNLVRVAVARELAGRPGKQLIIVSYGPQHDPNAEWVWNAADIDSSKIVWARDMGNDRNQELLNYFKDRSVWRANVDALPIQLEAYAGTGTRK
jgi:hypothetical protein